MITDTISFTLPSNKLNAKTGYLNLMGIKYMIKRIYQIDSTKKMYDIKNRLSNLEIAGLWMDTAN